MHLGDRIMPTPLFPGQQILVHHGCYEEHYQMKSMQMATDHYNIGMTLHGQRRTITPHFSYCYGAGDVALAPPYLFHRTTAMSEGPYERIMIKFSRKFAEPFIRELGPAVFKTLYETFVYHFTPKSRNHIRQMLFEMLMEYKKDTPYKEFILQGMLFRLFTTVLEEHLPTGSYLEPSPLSPQISDAIAYMEQHYTLRPTMEETAKHVGFSAGYFSRLFHAQLGMPYNVYLNNIRIRNVQIFLSNTDLSVSEIADKCGYCHIDYLSAQFKKITGMSPLQYRQRSLSGYLPS